MRRSAFSSTFVRPAAAVVALVGGALACHDAQVEPGPPVAFVVVQVPTTVIRVGETVRANALLADSGGQPVGPRPLTWRSSAPAVAAVSASGVVTGLAPGATTISAEVDGQAGQAELRVVRPTAASLSVAPDSLAIAATVSVPLTLTARDAAGATITGVEAAWGSSNPLVALVSPTGRVTAVAPGTALVTASVDGLTAIVRVTVTRPSNVRVTAASSTLLLPGATLTLDGSGFSTNRAANTVTIGGLPATVRTATPTQLTVAVPTAGWPCEPTREVPVVVSVSGESGTITRPLQVATLASLRPGEGLVLTDPAQARCAELVAGAGRYFVAVVNAATSSGAASAVRVRTAGALAAPAGDSATAPAARVVTSLRPGHPSAASADAPFAAPALVRPLTTAFVGAAARDDAAHRALLAFGRDALAAATAAPRPSVRAPGAVARAVGQAVLDTVTVRMLGPAARTCNDPTADVRARVVYVGRRARVLEDVTSPLAGTIDDDLAAIGREFDDVTFPMLDATFGNPLVLNGRLGRDGRVTLLFTRNVNARAGTLGLTLTCDLLPQSVARASNETETIYLAVPTSAAEGPGDGSPTGTVSAWRARIRAIVAHEGKHLTAYAEHLARGAVQEELWLEEGSALVAEELFARIVRARPLRANDGYAETVACERRRGAVGCEGDEPTAFSDAFARLYTALSDPETLGPLTVDPTVDPNAAYYGSAWWLLRWAADAHATSDAAFFRPLTTSTTYGAANVAARAGRPWGELLGDWWLATLADDYAGYAPRRVPLSEPSWNLRDVFRGLYLDAPTQFPRAFPVRARAVHAGDVGLSDAIAVRPGSAAIFELTGAGAARQLFELRAPTSDGAAPSPSFVTAIVRVQ